jgi:outer membrane protein assembly factor BamB
VGNNIVVARTTDSRFLAYDVTTGTRRWFYVRPPQALVLRSAPGVAFARGNIYAGLPGGKLIALAQTNGGIRWETVAAIPKGATELERVADVMGSPALGPRDACVATYQGRIGCYTLDGGTPIWSRDSSTSTGLGIDTRNAYVSDDKSTVQAYSRVAGASLWKNDSMTYRALCAPVAMGEAVVVGDYQGFMSWMSKEDGHFVARMPTDGSAIKMSPVTLESATQPTIIVQTQAGGVYAFATP